MGSPPTHHTFRFRIPARMSTSAVLRALAARWTVALEPPATTMRSYLDTADWRLYLAGLTLEADAAGEATNLLLTSVPTGAVRARAAATGVPHFAADLPEAGNWLPVRETLSDRRLLCALELRTSTRPARVLNADGKTTARVVVEHHAVPVGGGAVRRLPRELSIVPVRGYERAAARVAGEAQRLGLVPVDGSVLAVALAAAARPAPGRRPGPGVELDPGMPAGAAMAAVLGRLREELVANEAGVREQLDDEFLHDFRVAVRRARSILKLVRAALPEREAIFVAGELKWLGDITSPARDLDVHLVQVQPGRAASGDLAPLRAHLLGQRDLAQRQLVEALDSARYHDVVKSWHSLEEVATATGSTAPIGDIATTRIGHAYRTMIRRGRAIGPLAPPEALHDLRKRGKELRYLLECFERLYPAGAVAGAVRELKVLQDNLGEYQDCQVQAAALRAMADDLYERRAAPAATLLAMGRLAEGLESREARARAEFSPRFRRFASAANRKRFDALLDGRAAKRR